MPYAWNDGIGPRKSQVRKLILNLIYQARFDADGCNYKQIAFHYRGAKRYSIGKM